MMILTRAVARDFRVLFGRCVSRRPRCPALSELVVQVHGGVRTLGAATPEGVILTHQTSLGTERDERLVLPATLLAEVEGDGEDPVYLERPTPRRVVLRWADQDGPHSLDSECVPPGSHHELPDRPKLAPVSTDFLRALHECGRTAARENGRFALARIQVQGKSGRVIGTDSHIALLRDGFSLPFNDSILVPAIAVFGSKELLCEPDVRLGRTKKHLVVAAGPWAVWLPVDCQSRYPDVTAIIPRTDGAAVVGIDERDTEVLLRVLPELPGAQEEHRPVTLDLEGGVRVRAADATGAVREVYLARSPVAGPAVRMALGRLVLKRMLSLGCHTIRLLPGKPLVAEGPHRTVLAAPLAEALLVLPADHAVRTSTEEAVGTVPQPRTERTTPMKPTSNGHVPAPPADPADPLVLAEELRSALAETTAKAARLVAALRAGKKEKKALATVWAGLKQLNLGTPGA